MIQAKAYQKANGKDFIWTFRGERIILKGRDITYVHTEQRKVYVHTNKNTYRVSGNLKGVVSLLKDLPMVKTHSSYLVHMDHLEKISAHRAVLKNGEELPVSDRCWQLARPVIEQYYYEKAALAGRA